jgi:hypothetical protein
MEFKAEVGFEVGGVQARRDARRFGNPSTSSGG